jgi:Uma2 family endonuclease
MYSRCIHFPSPPTPLPQGERGASAHSNEQFPLARPARGYPGEGLGVRAEEAVEIDLNYMNHNNDRMEAQLIGIPVPQANEREPLMSIATKPLDREIIYPESDGQPMADNTLQFRWIVTLVGNLAALYREQPDVFVAGDLLWYPVEGHPEIRRAPDALVAFGRPQGYRGAYLQWKEQGIAPHVVFEVLSPGNTLREMAQKLQFYDRYGVEEYYLYDPDDNDLSGWLRRDGRLDVIEELQGWVSPRLGIRFETLGVELEIYQSDGRRFLTFEEVEQARTVAEALAERLAAQLRALGIEPDL